MAFDNLLIVLIGLIVVFVALMIFAIWWKKPLDGKKVQIQEGFNRYYEHFDTRQGNTEMTKECVHEVAVSDC